MKFLIALLFSFPVLASEVTDICGMPKGWIPNLFNDLEKTRVKCVNDYFDRKKKETEDEIARIMEIHNQMKAELKKVAFKVDYNIVLCTDKNNPSYPKEKTKRCQEIVTAQNALLERVDILNGWEKKVQSQPKAEVKNQDLTLPCPTQQQLNDMQAVRYFNKKAHETWTRCTLDQI